MVAVLFEPHILPQTWQGAAALLAMAWVSHAGGQGLLVFALGRLPAVFSSLVIFLEAMAAALFGWALLAEPLSLPQALGGALILVGIWADRAAKARSPVLIPHRFMQHNVGCGPLRGLEAPTELADNDSTFS